MNKLLIILLSIIVLVSSCKKDAELDLKRNLSPFNTTRLTNEILIDEKLEMISKVIAIAQTNSDFRSIILNEAKLNINLENAVLYYRIKDLNISSLNTTVKEYFFQINSNLNFGYDQDYFDCGIVEDLPQLCLNLYIIDDDIEISEIETWGLSLVFPSNSSFEDEGDYDVTAYNYQLNEYQINNNVEPEDQNLDESITSFIIIENNQSFIITNSSYLGENDNTLFDNLLIDEPSQNLIDTVDNYLYANNDYLYININTCNLNLKLVSGLKLSHIITDVNDKDCRTGDPKPGNNCDRDLITGHERLTKIRIQSSQLKLFCKWSKKTAKVKVILVYFTSINGTFAAITAPTQFVVTKRKNVKKNKSHEITNSYFIRWLYLEGIDGSPYSMNFIGINSNTGTETTTSIQTANTFSFKDQNGNSQTSNISSSISVKTTTKDLEMGGQYVYYCDNLGVDWTGHQYNTGIIEFWINKSAN